MTGQMAWLDTGDDRKVLYIRTTPRDRWERYTKSPLAVPDHQVPDASKGYATAQKLLRMGWVYVPTDQANQDARENSERVLHVGGSGGTKEA